MMKKLLFFLGIAGSVWACTTLNAEDSKAEGEQLYRTYCVACHGAKGNMGGSGAFDLTVSPLTLDQRIEVITNGRNAMASFKTMIPPSKIRAVAEYTMQLKPSMK
ncbi:MAG: c-type cytochrome [Lewinellaceae bacterium]|nr:c-type cytochrome [Lewinellaceae bacterium]